MFDKKKNNSLMITCNLATRLQNFVHAQLSVIFQLFTLSKMFKTILLPVQNTQMLYVACISLIHVNIKTPAPVGI